MIVSAAVGPVRNEEEIMSEPMIVVIPEGLTVRQVEDAITVCRRVGLLYEGDSFWLLPQQLLEQASKVLPYYVQRQMDGEQV
jgi:hypothetical protein